MDVNIRKANSSDINDISKISSELGYPTSSEQVLTRYIKLQERMNDNSIYIAELSENKKIVGWIHVYAVYLLESDGYAEIG
jgi:hypothetical protein